MPKKTGKGKKKVKKKKSTKSPETTTEIGKVSNKTMVQQMASVSLSPTPTRKSTARERLVEAVQQAEMEKERRFMKGKISSKAYEQLTPHEIRDLRIVFDTFDTDRSGSIDARELRKAMRTLGFKIPKASLEAMISNLDTDESGEIEFDEFLDFIVSRQADSRDVHDEILQGFKMFDTDKSGHISLDDLKKVSRLSGLKLNEKELKEMIYEADKDGDNQVDQEEFVNMMLKTNLFP
ncbi:caltractin-like [Actinia tenebrosa]|uniref:Caltractin-like n=1 Tax=Actinia tenebrosa TaxID=6105 RepID=A0A6P8HMJ7_ACTTE|nr:caltractin-like [Actinia tenebrosa]